MGVDIGEYLNVDNYIDPTYSNSRRKKLKKLIEKIKGISETTMDTPTKFYRENHNHIPAWILLKNITFNDTIDLFSFLKKGDKLEIINNYFTNVQLDDEEKIKLFKNMLTIVRKFRNKIAHNLKPISYKAEKVELSRKSLRLIVEKGLIIKNDTKKGIGTNDFYSMILSEIVLLGQDYTRMMLIIELTNILSVSEGLENGLTKEYISVAHFPENILERLEKAYAQIFARHCT